MDKKKAISWLYWIMIAFVIITCIYVVVYLQSNANNCLTDPIKFYADKINQQCFCMPKTSLFP